MRIDDAHPSSARKEICMSLFAIAFKNVKKNVSFYFLYLVSVAFILTVFFSFVSFSMNGVMLAKISEDGRVETMSRTIAVFLMAFVLFYMSYSNQFFMKRRMRELGIYALLGYRKSAMLKLLAFENVLICLLSLVVGIVLGAAAHQGIVSGVVGLLDLSIDRSAVPFLNGKAVLFSVLFVIGVIAALSISNWRLLRKTTLLHLVRLEKSGEKKMKIRPVSAVIGLILMVSGDVLALDSQRGKESVWSKIGVSPIGLLMTGLIVCGTALFVYSFLPYVMQKLKQRERLLYREISIVAIPKFMNRIRTNAKTLIMLSLLSAATLGVFGSTVLTSYYPVAALTRIIPSALEFKIERPEQAEQAILALNRTVGEGGFQSKITELIKAGSTTPSLPPEYSLAKEKGREPGFELMSSSDYASLLKQQGKKTKDLLLDDKEAILVKYRPDPKRQHVGETYSLILADNQTVDVAVKGITLDNPIGFNNSVGTLIVSDGVFRQFADSGLPDTRIMSIDGPGLRDSKEAYEALQPVLGDNPYFASVYARTYEITYSNSSTFLLLGFLTVLFFIASGSILYFHNISAVTYDRDDYTILSKMGYSRKKLKKLIHRQILVLYSIPFILGLAHSICGLFCYKALLMDDVLGQSSKFILPIALALSISVFIYLIYYVVTKRSCYRIALKN